MSDDLVRAAERLFASKNECSPAANKVGLALLSELATARQRADRAVFLAEHLFQMIPREAWREQGVEWMGHYEGDAYAERTLEELRELRAALDAGQPQ